MNQVINNQYFQLNSLGEMWDLVVSQFGDIIALSDPHSQTPVELSYREVDRNIKQFAAGLQSLAIESGEKIALFADNSPRWLIADQGIIRNGCVDAVRSSQADREELLYILGHSDSTVLVIENLTILKKLQPELSQFNLKSIILLSDEAIETEFSQPIYNFEQFMVLGKNHTFTPVSKNLDDLATLIYTSGTTGQPKGVMLSHGNLLHQVRYLETVIKPLPGDRILSILPSWHSYERAAEYFLLSRGTTLIYTNIRYFKADLKEYRPHFMVGVPRLWESIYEGIQKQFRDGSKTQQKLVFFFLSMSEKYLEATRISKGLTLDNLNPSPLEKITAQVTALLFLPLHKLGDKLVYQKVRDGVGSCVKTWISGGGSLPKHIDNFFQIVGISLIVGYGLTETSPVTNARRFDRNIVGASGQPIPETEIKIIDLETKETLPQGKIGLVYIRGSQVMQGYYKNPSATAKAIDSDGWFDSGDLGWVTPENDLVITGRAKDTIVLSNGENIEPQPLEDACVRSPYIDQIMVVGQDQKYLGALIVPNLDALRKWTQSQNLSLTFPDVSADLSMIENSDLYAKEVISLYKQELNREVKNRAGYRPDDRISVFKFIVEPFSMDNGMMTQTLKIKRPVITSHYQDMINSMFL
ncbi:long-chain fatty acid--CoA ligase [Geminocystis sp. NIES-3709]|uniref:AMP-dependent synthetase/ligase n=1 Tax=Geminocystis sp. NIES-3709 TaxID=1617448 RepID=UPI0005FC9C2A|nr:long-chain fatty acid--CoA ligase [Geminocystis sp. NIES-3709]BAQ66540.1 long-chain-fatty-acid--CoA ligase [Geminocystis sp. NIES-3709]